MTGHTSRRASLNNRFRCYVLGLFDLSLRTAKNTTQAAATSGSLGAAGHPLGQVLETLLRGQARRPLGPAVLTEINCRGVLQPR